MAGLDGRSAARAKWVTLATVPGVPISTRLDQRLDHQEAPMPGTELRTSGPRSRIGPQRGRLRAAASAFQATAGARAGDSAEARAAWLAAVGRTLSGLAEAWREHVEFTEAPDGLFDELLDDSFEVAPEVDHLRRDHEALVAAIARARELLASPTAGPADTKLLQCLAGIAKQVEQHRRRGADLLYQVYSVDVSAGD
jgi:hypothetical protein